MEWSKAETDPKKVLRQMDGENPLVGLLFFWAPEHSSCFADGQGTTLHRTVGSRIRPRPIAGLQQMRVTEDYVLRLSSWMLVASRCIKPSSNIAGWLSIKDLSSHLPEPLAASTKRTRHASFIDGVDLFDNKLFGLSLAETKGTLAVFFSCLKIISPVAPSNVLSFLMLLFFLFKRRRTAKRDGLLCC